MIHNNCTGKGMRKPVLYSTLIIKEIISICVFLFILPFVNELLCKTSELKITKLKVHGTLKICCHMLSNCYFHYESWQTYKDEFYYFSPPLIFPPLVFYFLLVLQALERPQAYWAKFHETCVKRLLFHISQKGNQPHRPYSVVMQLCLTHGKIFKY